MAQYAIFMYAPAVPDEGEPSVEGRAVYDQHAEDLQSSAALVAAFALHPATTATSIRGDVYTDGPFLEAKEVIVGFYVIEADDLDAALAVARQNPILRDGGGLEVRPVEGSSINR